MRKLLRLSGSLLALAGACSPTLAPVYAPVETAGLSASGTPYTAAQIDKAAVAAAQAKGWKIISVAPELTVAEASASGHTARVRIVTSGSGWQIQHEASSAGLKFHNDATHGDVVSRRYNQWVRALDEAIHEQLALQ